MNILEKTILSIEKTCIIINCADKKMFKILKQIGAKRKLFTRFKWILPCADKNELSNYFKYLRDYGFMFSGGNGWPPSCVFQQLKDEGYIEGHILEIVWKDQNTPIIYKK